LGGGEAGAEAVLPLSELWKQMTEVVRGVVKGENEENGDSVQQTGANITSALTSKAASVRKEKESSTTTKETHTTERWGREGGTTIHQISFTVDISKIKDLPLLYKLIDELKDAQKELADGEKELADGEKEIEENEKKLADGRQQFAEGQSALEQGEQEYQSGLSKYQKESAAAQKKLEAAKKRSIKEKRN